MDSYYFIRYNQLTTIKHISEYAKTKAIICFDFEDSIKGVHNKSIHRAYFNSILTNIVPKVRNIKIGLRLNAEVDELQKDIESIKNQKIHSLFIPKIETNKQILEINTLLVHKQIGFEELIPIIESNNSLKNLNEIIDNLPKKVKRIGFGHCDYNLNIKAFPFFHQDTTQYWKWVNEFYKILIPRNISFINSPFLKLGDDVFFNSMLHHLVSIFGMNVGQFCLTKKQANITSLVSKNKPNNQFNLLLNSRFDLKCDDNFTENIITEFEQNSGNKNFSISKKNKFLISPHEYKMAKYIKSKNHLKPVNLTYVGGCFPIQHNIFFEDLFHQKLKRKIESNIKITLNVNIIRYERFLTCLTKIKSYNSNNAIDFIVFHIRPEPFLRIIKFYYKYLNNKGKLKHSLNIPLLRILNPEKYDILNDRRQRNFLNQHKESKIKEQLITLNYQIGCLFGNRKISEQKYFRLIKSIIKYCQNNNIKLIIIGPPIRSGNKIEPKLTKTLNRFMKIKLKEEEGFSYIEGMVSNLDKEKVFFNSNGIHATEAYHQYIADKLHKELIPKIAT